MTKGPGPTRALRAGRPQLPKEGPPHSGSEALGGPNGVMKVGGLRSQNLRGRCGQGQSGHPQGAAWRKLIRPPCAAQR
jgi:hypothetical protein